MNLMVHVFNSLIMLIDLTIVGHPIQLSHAYFTMGIGLVYSIFTAIYFLVGGTTRYSILSYILYALENIYLLLIFKIYYITQLSRYLSINFDYTYKNILYLLRQKPISSISHSPLCVFVQKKHLMHLSTTRLEQTGKINCC